MPYHRDTPIPPMFSLHSFFENKKDLYRPILSGQTMWSVCMYDTPATNIYSCPFPDTHIFCLKVLPFIFSECFVWLGRAQVSLCTVNRREKYVLVLYASKYMFELFVALFVPQFCRETIES